MTRQTRGFRVLVLLVALALLGAACGDDDDDDSSASEGPSGTLREGSGDAADYAVTIDRPLQGVTDTEITVGGLATLTSPRLSTFTGVEQGALAWFEAVNAKGGVAGRKINFLGVRDDAESNETNTSEARKLVEQEKVFAVVPVVSNVFAGSTVLQRADVPYFGWGFHEAFCEQPEGFSFNGCGTPLVEGHKSFAWPGLVKKALPEAKTVSFTVEDTAAARAGTERYLRALPELGLESVLEDFSVPIGGNADFTPYVQKVIAADPDVAFIVSGGATAVQLAGRLKAAGFKGTVTSPAIYDPRIASTAQVAQAIDGIYAYVGFAPFDSDNEAMQQMKADLDQYAPEGTLLTQPFASGYLSAMLFTQILEEVGEDLTYERFYEVANSFAFDGNGALAEHTFPKAKRFTRECGSLVQLRDAKFETAVDLTCIRD